MGRKTQEGLYVFYEHSHCGLSKPCRFQVIGAETDGQTDGPTDGRAKPVRRPIRSSDLVVGEGAEKQLPPPP